MTIYRIFLTKSNQAAHVMAHAYTCDIHNKANGVVRVKCGSADDEKLIPAIFYGNGYFYCAAEIENSDNSNSPKYELIIC